MSSSEKLIVEICRVAAELSTPQVDAVTEVLRGVTPAGVPSVRLELTRAVAQPHHRAILDQLVTVWEREAPEISPAALALALTTADRCEELERQAERVELVWTGPRVDGSRFRRTDQALLELIEGATDRLTIVSFAIYKAEEIMRALEVACRRGVEVLMILESAEESDGRLTLDAVSQIGSDLASRVATYVWPLEHRPRTKANRPAALHAKCAVADGRRVFVSSANLTGYGMEMNMEMGVLITGGPQPRQVQDHFDALRATGVLQPIQAPPISRVLAPAEAETSALPEWAARERAVSMRHPVAVCTFVAPAGWGAAPLERVGFADLGRPPGPGEMFIAPVPGSAMDQDLPAGTWAVFRRCLPEEALPDSSSCVVVAHPRLTTVDHSSGVVFREVHYFKQVNADHELVSVEIGLWPRSSGAKTGRIRLMLGAAEWHGFRPVAQFLERFIPGGERA